MISLIRLFLLLSTFSVYQAFIRSRRRLRKPIRLHATATITFDQVYYQHKSHWTRRLLSSEPRRKWALENLSFHLKSELVLLVGASACGKSTALQLMCTNMNQEHHDPKMAPTHGTIHVSSPPIYIGTGKLFDTSEKEDWSIRSRLQKRPNLVEALQLASCANKTSSQLSLSEQYKLRLAEFCIVAPDAPILLLDEWLDNEPTSIVSAVEAALQSFVAKTNGIVVVVTHKKDRWKTRNSIELRSGKLVERTHS